MDIHYVKYIEGVYVPQTLSVPVTENAVHEEELMRSDFVRLSWRDSSYYEIPIGAYIIPYPNVIGYDGQPAHFTLYQAYKPDKSSDGYKYEPQFLHPKMWLKYVPYLFATKDAAGNDIKKSEFDFIGELQMPLVHLRDAINEAFGFADGVAKFTVVAIGINPAKSVSVTYSETDILSAIENLAKVCECEYLLDWDAKIFYFGKIFLGTEPYDLTADENIGVPSITRSKDVIYNQFLVQGSSRNNTRVTSAGNNVALNTRLVLDETKYPNSIIDTRREFPYTSSSPKKYDDVFSPAITQYLTFDDVYPRQTLYLYDLHERRMMKKVEETNEYTGTWDWSIWYFKLAYKDANGNWKDYVMSSEQVFANVLVRMPNSAELKLRNNVADDEPLPLIIDMKDGNFFDTYSEKTSSGVTTQRGCVVSVGNKTYTLGVSTFRCGSGFTVSEYDGYVLLRKSKMSWGSDFEEFVSAALAANSVTFTSGVNAELVPQKNTKTAKIDGLTPSIAFQINTLEGYTGSLLGTREFEVEYHTSEVSFNKADDYDKDSGLKLGAGYYEIIKTTEGSDELIVPTKSTDGIYPHGASTPQEYNDMCFLFNIVVGSELRDIAQAELAEKALTEIAGLELDTNNYTFKSCPIRFDKEKPALFLGRRVLFKCDNVKLETRVLKLSTKLDIVSVQDVTIGNKVVQGDKSIMKKDIDDLNDKYRKFAELDYIDPFKQEVRVIDRGEWVAEGLYYFESLNKFPDPLIATEPYYETSEVWHNGKKWRCKRNLTVEEPSLGCYDWQLMAGDTTFAMKFYNTDNNAPYGEYITTRRTNINIPITPRIFWGTEDITDLVSKWQWQRVIGEEYDTGWAIGHDKQSIVLTTADMPTGWSYDNPAVFECNALVPRADGDDDLEIVADVNIG